MVFLSVTLVLLAVAYAAMLWRFTAGFRRLVGSWKDRPQIELPTVSVVVAARNEADSIGACVRSILANDYPSSLVEILVVDDGSSDQTAEIVSDLITANANLGLFKLSLTEVNSPGKRRAIEAGIARTTGEIIVLTDADTVVPATWIHTIVSSFRDNVRFVAGPVAYSSGSNWLGRLLELELLGLVGVGAGAIALGHPNMCNGANVAFRRTTFLDIDGYAGTDHLASGDDELLMQKIARKYPGSVQFCPDHRAVVTTAPPAGFTDLLRQRRRWASKGLHYTDGRITIIALLVYGFNLLFLCAVVALLINSNVAGALVAATLLKLGAETWLFWTVCSWFDRRHLMTEIIPGQLIEIPYVVLVGAAGVLGGYNWKDRHIRR